MTFHRLRCLLYNYLYVRCKLVDTTKIVYSIVPDLKNNINMYDLIGNGNSSGSISSYNSYNEKKCIFPYLSSTQRSNKYFLKRNSRMMIVVIESSDSKVLKTLLN